MQCIMCEWDTSNVGEYIELYESAKTLLVSDDFYGSIWKWE